MKNGKAVASVLLSGALWGCISIFVRSLSAGRLDSLQISAIRLVFGAVLMIVFF